MPINQDEIKLLERQMDSVLEPTELEKLARETKFIQRSTNRIVAKDFIQLMSMELMSNPRASHEELCRILKELNPGLNALELLLVEGSSL